MRVEPVAVIVSLVEASRLPLTAAHIQLLPPNCPRSDIHSDKFALSQAMLGSTGSTPAPTASPPQPSRQKAKGLAGKLLLLLLLLFAWS